MNTPLMVAFGNYAVIVAAGQADPSNPTIALIGYLANFGVLGFITIDALWTRKLLAPARELRTEQERSARYEKRLEHLNDKMMDEVMPAIKTVTDVAKENMHWLLESGRGR